MSLRKLARRNKSTLLESDPAAAITADDAIQMTLGDHKMKFAHGKWKKEADGTDEAPPRISKVEAEEEIKRLEDENRLLEFKAEVLLEMVAETEEDMGDLKRELKEVDESVEEKKDTVRQLRDKAIAAGQVQE